MYTKHSNLVDADVSGAKDNTKHLESRLEVIQGQTFWDYYKADQGCVLLYNTVGFTVRNFEGRSEHLRFREPYCHSGAPCLGNPLRVFAQALYL